MKNFNITPDEVRHFLLARYCEQIQGKGRTLSELPNNFDFLLEGIVDSFGILEMVSAVEKKFEIELDMADLDAEQMTILGPLACYVAEQVNAKRNGFSVSS